MLTLMGRNKMISTKSNSEIPKYPEVRRDLPYRSKRNYDSIYYIANRQKKPLKKVNLFDDNLP
jgi:phenylalanyl-tRNA synthetase beta subunit